ncbi:MAG: hypothetical protein R6V01_06895 [Thermoplasmatota archaeon]
MTKVARCPKCGEYTSMIWTDRNTCRTCGEILLIEDIEHPLRRFPRAMNALGVLAMVAVIILFVISLTGSDMPADILIVFAVLSGLLFLSSLALQYKLEKQAIKKHSERITNRRQRRVRKDVRGQKRDSPKSGTVVKKGAIKIPLK